MSASFSASGVLWDRVTRLLHWTLALSVIVALVSAFVLPPAAMTLHYWAGGVAVAAVGARLVWGVFGRGHSRFGAFPLRPTQILEHVRAVRSGLRGEDPGRHWPGHPPLGALMVVFLLAGVTVLGISGVIALGGQEAAGPLAGRLGFAAGHSAAEVHEVVGFGVLALVVGHLLGILVESRLMGENLARSMVTGRRRRPALGTGEGGRPVVGMVLAGTLVLGGGAGAWALTESAPSPFAATAAPPDYAAECGACHMAYPASLLPAASWQTLMADLSNHFGEDAWLPPGTAAPLTAWLTTHAAETRDTKAGRVFRRVDAAHPMTITATPFWQRRHDELPEALFRSAAVRSPANCKACHADAEIGAFRRVAIAIPD